MDHSQRLTPPHSLSFYRPSNRRHPLTVLCCSRFEPSGKDRNISSPFRLLCCVLAASQYRRKKNPRFYSVEGLKNATKAWKIPRFNVMSEARYFHSSAARCVKPSKLPPNQMCVTSSEARGLKWEGRVLFISCSVFVCICFKVFMKNGQLRGLFMDRYEIIFFAALQKFLDFCHIF